MSLRKTAVLLAVLVAAGAFAAARRAQPLQFKYFGAAGWEITDGKTVVLVDPYLTRAKYPTPNDAADPADTRPLVTGTSIVPTDTAVVDANITRADVIVLTHSHPDHSLDMPYIAKKTGATVVGTESTGVLARVNGVPEKQIRVVAGKEELSVAGASIRVIPSLHGIFQPANPNAPAPRPPVIPPTVTAPLRYVQHQEGGTLAYLIGLGGHQILVFGSMNYIEAEVTGLRPDIALIGAMPERQFIDNYTPRLMKALGNPPIVIPTHWDRFNVPYGFSQQGAIDRLQSFIAEIKAASPQTKVMVGEHLKPFTVK